jgi:uncharacterized paraquat-inducible protein A
MSASTITCRRCREPYLLAPRTILPACPHCGASPTALWRKLQNNALAAVLAVLALGVLAVGMATPFVSMSQLGEERVFSLLGGIAELFRDRDFLLGSILLTFSVIFPIVKLTGILIATSRLAPLSIAARRRLHKFVILTGKYSLLDVLVVAVMIVLVKFDQVARVSARAGTAIFSVAIFMSLFAGMLVKLPEEPA